MPRAALQVNFRENRVDNRGDVAYNRQRELFPVGLELGGQAVTKCRHRWERCFYGRNDVNGYTIRVYRCKRCRTERVFEEAKP